MIGKFFGRKLAMCASAIYNPHTKIAEMNNSWII